jgi:hypothetical protein
MNYKDRTSNPNGIVRTQYADLAETTNYDCDQPCLCRFNGERSVKDKMYYDWFVLDKPLVLPPAGQKVEAFQNVRPIKNSNQK